MVINYAIEVASRGFPLSHRRLKEHVDSICHVRLGRNFPTSGVGKNWTSHFISKNSDWLSTYWTHNLDEKWGWAVNPHTNKEWFDLLKDVLKGNRDSEFDDPPPSPTGAGSRDQDGDDDGDMLALASLEKDTYGDDGVDEDNNGGHEPIRWSRSSWQMSYSIHWCSGSYIGVRGSVTHLDTSLHHVCMIPVSTTSSFCVYVRAGHSAPLH